MVAFTKQTLQPLTLLQSKDPDMPNSQSGGGWPWVLLAHPLFGKWAKAQRMEDQMLGLV